MGFDEPKSTDNAMHQVMHEARDYQRIEVEIGGGRMVLTGPVDPVVVTALVAALRAP